MKKNGILDRAADRFMDLDDPSYGDERERAVFMESSSFGITLGIYVSLVAAAIAALFGQLLLPVVLLIVMVVPTWAMGWYAWRRGVSISDLASRAGRRSRNRAVVAILIAIIVIFGSMFITVWTGRGIFVMPEISLTFDRDAGLAMIAGALVGGVCGLLALFATRLVRRTLGRKTAAPTDADLD